MKRIISTVIAGLIVFAGCSTPDTSSHVKAGSSVELTTTTTEVVETTLSPTTTDVPMDPELEAGMLFFTGFIAQADPETVDTVCNMEDVLGSQGAAEYLSENAEIYASAGELEGWAMVIDTLCN